MLRKDNTRATSCKVSLAADFMKAMMQVDVHCKVSLLFLELIQSVE